LQAHVEVSDLDVLELEVHANGGHIALLEDALAILGHEIGLANSAIADNHHLGQTNLFALLRH
jgi:hypothetical protein